MVGALKQAVDCGKELTAVMSLVRGRGLSGHTLSHTHTQDESDTFETDHFLFDAAQTEAIILFPLIYAFLTNKQGNLHTALLISL